MTSCFKFILYLLCIILLFGDTCMALTCRQCDTLNGCKDYKDQGESVDCTGGSCVQLVEIKGVRRPIKPNIHLIKSVSRVLVVRGKKLN